MPLNFDFSLVQFLAYLYFSFSYISFLSSKVQEAREHDRLSRAPSPLPPGWEERRVRSSNLFQLAVM